MKAWISGLVVFGFAGFVPVVLPADWNVTEESQQCIDCHISVSPGIVEDWRASRHSRITPAEARKKPELERRVSSAEIPEGLAQHAVGCYECHGQNAKSHPDTFDHFGLQIHPVVSPADCRTCHETEVSQYAATKKAEAVPNLRDNPVYHLLVETTTSVKEVRDGKLAHLPASANAKEETCYACHGTEVKVNGLKTNTTALGEIEVPNLSGWPNQGVGRINPDGTKGACTACHPRHSFSIEIARKPYTCSQCHLEPDLPAWDVYRESKHANILQSKQNEYDWDHVPWRVGTDLRAPTCATCHNSLLVSPDGEIIAERSHNFGARLWVRIFGLIYSHPQPKDGATYKIKNADGLPLPTTFGGALASDYLIDAGEQEKRQQTMKRVCQSCHGTSWADGHFAKLQKTLEETDKMVAAATQLMAQAWERGLADKSNPFNESLEQKWTQQWLFYANSVRYAAAMSGPDYAAFKNGWWFLTKNLQEMQESIGQKQKVEVKP